MSNLKYIVVLFLLLLSACRGPDSYDYLMHHPRELEKEYPRCENRTDAACTVVKQAAHDFDALMRERAEDPELFAQKVMHLQASIASLDPQSIEAKQQTQQLEMLYAVIAATSTE